MNDGTITLEHVLHLAQQLTPLDKVRLIEKVVPDLEGPVQGASTPPLRLQSAYGLCADLGTAPSSLDLDQVRQEMTTNFPRTDHSQKPCP